jgi:hypothetical protein
VSKNDSSIKNIYTFLKCIQIKCDEQEYHPTKNENKSRLSDIESIHAVLISEMCLNKAIGQVPFLK